ncbi:MAG: S41 family peptidase [Candidatus Aminicenantes bacterium]|nr:S41 family peptidase [Candidatus Aminicenantes bacterium]
MFAAFAISLWAALSSAPTSNVRPSLSHFYSGSAEAINRLQSQETKPPQVPYDAQKTYPVEALKEDLKLLWDMLDEGHGGFDRYTPKSAFKKSFDDAMAELTAPMTELDFYLKLLPLIAEIKDGHTRAQLSPPAGAFLDHEPVVLPFGLRFLEGKTYLFRNLSSDPHIKEGAELLSINGMTMAEILPKLLPLIPSDAGIRTRKLRQLEFPAAFGRLFALRFGRPGSFRLSFRPFQSDAIKELSVPGIRGEDVVKILFERYPDAALRRPLYELSFRGTTAVLTIRDFGDDPEKGSRPYPEFLKNAFRALEEKEIPNLIIDLRDNGGGRDAYGKLLFAYVMDQPFMYYRALETKKDRYDLFRFTDVPAKEVEELPKVVRKNARGWFDVLIHPNLGLQQPQSPRFTGKVAILLNGSSFSATGESTSLFHYHKKAVFFGEECGSGYYGNTSGFMAMATLPNTKIQVRIPLILYTMAVDGYPKDRGIVPDVPVTPTIEDLLAGRDPVMDRALEFLEKTSGIQSVAAKPAILPFPPQSKERTALIDEYMKKAPALADRFAPFVYKNPNGEAMPYRLFTPDGAVAGQKYPLVVFLHGAGWSGTDNVKQLQGANIFGGLAWTLPENQRRHPCFVVAPQSNVNWPCVIIQEGKRPELCPGQRLGEGARLAFEIIDKLVAELPVDPSRIYVTGHSMGGAGVWHMIARRPGFFAAAVPICGLPDFADARAMTSIPIWNFIGDLDPIEPVERQRRWIGEIVKAGGDPIYTEYAGVEHDSFMWAYTEPALVEWLFARQR